MNKEDNFKEKFKQALISTIKVISDEYRVETELKKNLSSKNYNFFELDNLSNKQDYIKIRYELLGTKMLKGISKNLKENYNHKIIIKRKDQLKTKEDVDISEAFELYMLKNFFDIKLIPSSEKILSFWENDFKTSLDKHLNYLNKNLEIIFW